MKTIQKSFFTEAFVRLNRLDEMGFRCWAVLPGMEFGSRKKWWAGTDSRPEPHEGLDICCFQNKDGRLINLTENSLVPALYDGSVVKIFADLLGFSILISHDFQDQGKTLFTIYAHTQPVVTLHRGKKVKAGEPIARVCPTNGKSIHPHLHLSTIWAHNEQVVDLVWQTIYEINDLQLCNPLEFL